MRTFEINIDYPMFCNSPELTTIRFEMPDDATEEEIEAEALQEFCNMVSYGVTETTEQQNEPAKKPRKKTS